MVDMLPPFSAAITERDIDSFIETERYWQPEDTAVTICLMKLTNGFQVTGFSAAASYVNFDAEYAKGLARDDAVSKIWALLAFHLMEGDPQPEESVPAPPCSPPGVLH